CTRSTSASTASASSATRPRRARAPRPPRSSRRRERRLGGDPPAELDELRRRRAEREFDLLRPEEVALDRVVDVDADPAVDVEGRVPDPAPALARPILRGRDLLRRRHP